MGTGKHSARRRTNGDSESTIATSARDQETHQAVPVTICCFSSCIARCTPSSNSTSHRTWLQQQPLLLLLLLLLSPLLLLLWESPFSRDASSSWSVLQQETPPSAMPDVHSRPASRPLPAAAATGDSSSTNRGSSSSSSSRGGAAYRRQRRRAAGGSHARAERKPTAVLRVERPQGPSGVSTPEVSSVPTAAAAAGAAAAAAAAGAAAAPSVSSQTEGSFTRARDRNVTTASINAGDSWSPAPQQQRMHLIMSSSSSCAPVSPTKRRQQAAPAVLRRQSLETVSASAAAGPNREP